MASARHLYLSRHSIKKSFQAGAKSALLIGGIAILILSVGYVFPARHSCHNIEVVLFEKPLVLTGSEGEARELAAIAPYALAEASRSWTTSWEEAKLYVTPETYSYIQLKYPDTYPREKPPAHETIYYGHVQISEGTEKYFITISTPNPAFVHPGKAGGLMLGVFLKTSEDAFPKIASAGGAPFPNINKLILTTPLSELKAKIATTPEDILFRRSH